MSPQSRATSTTLAARRTLTSVSAVTRYQHHSGRSADTHECLRSHAPRTELHRLLYTTCDKNERTLFKGVFNLPNGGDMMRCTAGVRYGEMYCWGEIW